VLAALLELQVGDVRNVAVAGDTTNDLVSGYRAGARILAGVLTAAHDRGALESAPHTHILYSIGELPALVQSTDVVGLPS
jgi:phosphoglycolate phosphatase-like HAD superfamily hydrolase